MAWQEWLDLQWNRPSRADYYAMRVAQVWGGGDLKEYKVDFKEDKPPDLSKLTKRELKFYTECGNDLEAWKAKAGRVDQNATAAAIGAKYQ